MRRIRLTGQTWLSLVSAVAFVALALALAVLPVPYVIYSPGSAYDLLALDEQDAPQVSVEGIPAYPVTGQLFMTTVAMSRADARVSLPESVLAYWLPQRDAIPRAAVYDPGKTNEELRTEVRMMMDTSQQDAVVAALREADVPVDQLPVVSAVTVAGPADGRLRPGDLILAVDGEPAPTPADVAGQIRSGVVGEPVRFTVERDHASVEVEVPTIANSAEVPVASVGIEVGMGYRFAPSVEFGISHDVGGPSAGLMFALAVYDRITPGDLLQGRAIAGTGEIDANGEVRRIGGLQQKLAGAEREDISVFLVPSGNCGDLGEVRSDLRIIRVDTLSDAVQALQTMDEPLQPPADVQTC